MVVKIEELREGDEILIPSGSKLIYARVLRNPRLKFRKDVNGVNVPVLNWGSTEQAYSSVCCSINIVSTSCIRYNRPHVEKHYVCTAEGHNSDRYFSLNRTTMWKIDNNMDLVYEYLKFKKSLKEEQ